MKANELSNLYYYAVGCYEIYKELGFEYYDERAITAYRVYRSNGGKKTNETLEQLLKAKETDEQLTFLSQIPVDKRFAYQD